MAKGYSSDRTQHDISNPIGKGGSLDLYLRMTLADLEVGASFQHNDDDHSTDPFI